MTKTKQDEPRTPVDVGAPVRINFAEEHNELAEAAVDRWLRSLLEENPQPQPRTKEDEHG